MNGDRIYSTELPLELTDVSWGYAGRPALGKGLSLHVKAGEALAIIGPNGIGKTTLLRTIAGHVAAKSGELRLGGMTVDALSSQQRAQRVSCLPPQAAVEVGLTVRELVALGRTPFLARWGRLGRPDQQAIDQAIDVCDLDCLADRRLATLSEGERQRAFIAVVVAQNAPLALLDEPSSHLDLHWRHHFFVLLNRLRGERGMAVIYVLHDLADAFREADRIFLVSKDRIAELNPRQRADCRSQLAAAFAVPESYITIPFGEDTHGD